MASFPYSCSKQLNNVHQQSHLFAHTADDGPADRQRHQVGPARPR